MSDDQHPEIVIVKRHARHVDEHHGGAWKIAFADFMTAMMALFLVLWLISSTSEKQRRAVAQYFNPVKLVDMTTMEKGFHDPKETEHGSGRMTEPTPSEKGARESDPAAMDVEGAKLSGQAKRLASNPQAGVRMARDARSRQGPAPKRGESGGDPANAADLVEASDRALAEAFADPFATVPNSPRPPDEADPEEAESRPGRQRSRPRSAGGDNVPELAALTPDAAEVAALESEIRAGVGPGADKPAAPRLEIRATDEGLLISLTDAADATMFAIGSAEPHRRTIELIQRIALSLAKRPGSIVVRGHTDSRPYRTGTSDNWRLSTARAHAARDVLVRGGLGEGRIERVEGHADRSPKVAADPAAPENRRIEILLRKVEG